MKTLITVIAILFESLGLGLLLYTFKDGLLDFNPVALLLVTILATLVTVIVYYSWSIALGLLPKETCHHNIYEKPQSVTTHVNLFADLYVPIQKVADTPDLKIHAAATSRIISCLAAHLNKVPRDQALAILAVLLTAAKLRNSVVSEHKGHKDGNA